jgi:hypothetical protein
MIPIEVFLVALPLAYMLGRRHGRKAVQRAARGLFGGDD